MGLMRVRWHSGDSSGAHTALMAGITGDAEYLPEKYPQTTTEVDCIIDWFGPTDLVAASQYPSAIDHDSADSPSGVLIGGKALHDHPEDAYPANPVYICAAIVRHRQSLLCMAAATRWFRLISPAFYMRH